MKLIKVCMPGTKGKPKDKVNVDSFRLLEVYPACMASRPGEGVKTALD